MKTTVHMKSALLSGASLVAVGLMLSAAPANAQEMETVTVTGIRASLQSAQAIKENSNQVVDSITAVDIGALPDRNVADALQRIPGVTLQRTDQQRDPVRFGGTGSTVFIRGLSWSQALTNGRDVFSATNGRGLSFADVSADLLSGVDVYKNPTADQIEGSVGGTIDLKTRKPFDQDGQLIAVSGDITYALMNDRGTASGNALYSNRFNTKIGEIGAMVSVDWQDQRNRTNAISKSEYYCVDFDGVDSTGAAIAVDSTACKNESLTNSAGKLQKGYVPGALGPRTLDWQQQRFATDVVLQWRPSDKLEFTIEGLNAISNPNDKEHTVLYYPTKEGPTATNGYQFDSNGTWYAGKFDSNWTQFDTRVTKNHNRTSDVSLNVKYTPTSQLTLTADVQAVESVATVYSMTAFISGSMPGGVASWDFSGGLPKVSFSNSTQPAVTNYGPDAYMDHFENNAAHALSYRGDAHYDFAGTGLGGWVKSIQAGFRGENKLSVTRATGYGWEGSGFWWAYMPGTEKLTEYYSFGDLLGNSGVAGYYFRPDVISQGTKHIIDVTKAAISGSSPDFYSTRAGCSNDTQCPAQYDTIADGTNGVNRVSEDIISGYVMTNFSHDNFLGYDIPIDGNIGVRIVNTEDQISAGKLVAADITGTCALGKNGVGATVTTCADYTAAKAFIGSGGGLAIALPAVKNSYTDATPSFNFRAHLSDALQVRLAYSQAIVRPQFNDMRNYQSVGYNFGSQALGLEGTLKEGIYGKTGSAGNPNLKPMHAQQYDISFEYYFSGTNSISFALFHKDLSNYFYTATGKQTVTNPLTSKTDTFNVTTTLNGGKGKVEGFEFAYQQFFDGLPGAFSGVGVQANYTKIYNSGGANKAYSAFDSTASTNSQVVLPMEGMSNDSYNFAALYEKYGISGRLAYNWRSRFLYTSSAANANQPIWQKAYGQLDASVFYSFLDHYKVGIQATNLLDSVTKLEVGYSASDRRPYNWLLTDQKVSLMFRANW